MWHTILPALLVIGLATGCTGTPAASSRSLPDDALVAFAFHDASVPPPYHRSVTLTVTKEEAHLVVDSYGDVLADETAPTPASAWSTLSNTMSNVSGIDVSAAASGCVGGTGIDLSVSSGRDDLVDVSASFCGGSNAGVEDVLTAWVAPVRDVFPATDVLAPS